MIVEFMSSRQGRWKCIAEKNITVIPPVGAIVKIQEGHRLATYKANSIEFYADCPKFVIYLV